MKYKMKLRTIKYFIWTLLICDGFYYLVSLYRYFGTALFFKDPKAGMFFQHPFSSFSQEGYGSYTFLYWMQCFFKQRSVVIAGILIVLLIVLKRMESTVQRKKEEEYRKKVMQSLESVTPVPMQDPIISTIGQIKEEARQKELAYIQNNIKIKEEYENLAHQIKSALNALTLETEILLAKNGIPMESIEERGAHLNDLCEKMMELKEFAVSKNYYLNMQRVDLSHILYAVLKQLEPECQKKNIKVEKHIESCWIMADVFWMKEALETLVKNAVFYSPSNSVIEIDLYKTARKIRLDIKNDIDQDTCKKPDTIEDIRFNRYVQTSKKRVRKGIGLNMAKSVFSYHFGNLEPKWEGEDRFKIEGILPVSIYEE